MKRLITSVLTALCVGVTIGAMATDSLTASAARLVYERESLQNPPACVLTLEEPKVKNMTEWDYCRVDGEYDAWYFCGDGTATANPEIRFIADGVQTVSKPYTLTPIEVGSFSFEYAIVNNDILSSVADLPGERYIVQILASDGSYPIIQVDIEEDGDWHKITVTGATPIYHNEHPYSAYQDKFCGFLFKMGGLDGEFMIRNITLYDFNGEEITREIEVPDVENSQQEESSSETIEMSIEESNSASGVSTSQSSDASSKKGCGSFGVGTMTLGALTAAGLVLGISKKKRN